MCVQQMQAIQGLKIHPFKPELHAHGTLKKMRI
jgi:hypothetical protein